MDSAIVLLSAVLPPAEPPEPPQPGQCCVLGIECADTIDRSTVLGPTFTQYDLLYAPNSRRISVAAWRVLREPRLRRESWLVTNRSIKWLRREDVWPIMKLVASEKIAAPWAMYVTTSHKKHGSLIAPVNRSSSMPHILWENVIVKCPPKRVAHMIEHITMVTEYLPDVTRRGLCTGEWNPRNISKDALRVWIRHHQLLSYYQGDALWQFLLWSAPLPAMAKEKESSITSHSDT